jgi:ribonuclease HII
MNENQLICGVDEAGRGPLAGRVYAAAVILDDAKPISGLKDSKKLTEKQREYLFNIIIQNAQAYAITYVEPAEIDKINILNATLLAMKNAVEALSLTPNKVLVDGNCLPNLSIASEAIVKGDTKIAQISAASILAKVARDREMLRLDELYPHYGFAKHKGYGTQLHIQAIEKYGVLPIHRKTFAPLKHMN